MNYELPEGYQTNPVHTFVDSWEGSKDYQFWVYHKIKSLLTPTTRLGDVGCGYGWKLRYWIKPWCKDITGFDLPDVVDYCKDHHDFGTWTYLDLEHFEPVLGAKFDIVVCADVIEHLENPDSCLQYLREFSHPKTRILLSTPDRDKARGRNHMGPPDNPSHVREWNHSELIRYVESSGFKVLEAQHVHERKQKGSKTCQLLVLSL